MRKGRKKSMRAVFTESKTVYRTINGQDVTDEEWKKRCKNCKEKAFVKLHK